LDLRAKQNNAAAKQLDMLFEKTVALRIGEKIGGWAAYIKKVCRSSISGL
jgi:hypothetical protein